MIALNEIDALISEKLVTRRRHQTLPLCVFNYSAKAQHLPRPEWSYTLRQCRGLILDDNGDIVGRPFEKFWNYAAVLDQIPAHEPFTVWEKLDGSLGIVCGYRGHRVVATRGSFDSDQARWAADFLDSNWPSFYPPEDRTFLFEIIFPENRVVVDYGDRKELVLLAVLDQFARFKDLSFEHSIFPKARRFDGVTDFERIDADPQFNNQEGFVVRWQSGFLAKLKRADYVRLHRLITQCSTRTIWEMLRAGKSTEELFDRVPDDFRSWVSDRIEDLRTQFEKMHTKSNDYFERAPIKSSNNLRSTRTPADVAARKGFVSYALQQKDVPVPMLLMLLDGLPIDDYIWQLIEPKWATPFRCGEE